MYWALLEVEAFTVPEPVILPNDLIAPTQFHEYPFISALISDTSYIGCYISIYLDPHLDFIFLLNSIESLFIHD